MRQRKSVRRPIKYDFDKYFEWSTDTVLSIKSW